ncbi:MAG: aquaporin [Bacilli bacterium]|nr:aquaporin [Bacilli bacterium]
MNGLLKKGIAECLGTFTLVFIACGVAALTGGELVATALAFGLVIVAMAYSVGRISGCHINPAVSLAMLIAKKMSLKEFLVYIIAQLIGGFLGGLLIFGVAKMAGLHLLGDASNYVINFGMEGVTAGTVIGALLVEIVLTFLFIYVILNVTDSNNEGVGKKAGLIIGLTLTLVHLVGIPLTGTSVNPARSFATALNALIFNGTTDAIAQVWIFFVGPLLGGAIAALVFKLMHSAKN